MKKINKLKYFLPFAAIAALVITFSAFDNADKNRQVMAALDKDHTNKAAELVNSRRAHNFEKVNLFTVNNSQMRNVSNAVNRSAILNVDKSVLKSLNENRREQLQLDIPYADNKTIQLELVRVNLIPTGFKIKTPTGSEDYTGGVYYQGIVKGDENSIATVSIFKDDIISIVSTNEGIYNLGAITDDNKKNTNDYIFYMESDLTKANDFVCHVPDTYSEFNRAGNNHVIPTGTRSATTSPVRMYYIADYQMYTDRGNNTQSVANYVSAVFNQVRLLYQNESIGLEIAPTMFVYTSADPYRTFTTSQTEEILKEFGKNTKNNFDGDLAQLLSTRTPLTGAIAWVNVLCQSYEPGSQSGRYAYCQIENNYSNIPVYSWTIEVMAHETGHNFGSMHTHSCVWPTVSGQIDSCYTSEGGCVSGTRPNPNGTIMSYCHIPQGGGINFTLGFGPLPGDTIRLRYSQALCVDSALNSSENPLAFKLLQNYPNPFNPTTNIEFALPNEGMVTLRIYDVTGREIATLINSQFYNVGIFSYNLDASSYNLASGLYFYKLDVTRDNNSVYSEIKKMVLVK